MTLLRQVKMDYYEMIVWFCQSKVDLSEKYSALADIHLFCSFYFSHFCLPSKNY